MLSTAPCLVECRLENKSQSGLGETSQRANQQHRNNQTHFTSSQFPLLIIGTEFVFSSQKYRNMFSRFMKTVEASLHEVNGEAKVKRRNETFKNDSETKNKQLSDAIDRGRARGTKVNVLSLNGNRNVLAGRDGQ